ncbi:hypothetical protein D9Q98_001397 [Chlorella vulgaris]|uniref:Septin-type G domain-containing protein n=1 Tax=Chlorella vulgaris TaxID=3077 RepID=A0A9D4Z215_CHLVU|nr:hypothetical protein D9Q98_001397 [Chlorella vulgaris]
MSTTSRVLLNATRSEAQELLTEPAPPRLRSEDGSPFASKRGPDLLPGHMEYETEETEVAESGVWAPASRSKAPSPPQEAANGDSSSQVQVVQTGGAPDGFQSSTAVPAATVAVTVAPATPPRGMPLGAVPQAAVSVEGHVRSAQDGASELREADVRGAFVGLPRIKPQWTHKYMKLLLVGESGLGKTTFVRNLFAAYARDASFPVNDASTPNAPQIFVEKPQALCTEIVLQDSDNKVYFHYLVQDTPGYGDSTDLAADRRVILDYIQDSSSTYLEQEQDPERKAAMHAIKDTRVDACLYFIPPHRLRKIDLGFMAELAAVVPVVPVLAKADTMTAEELKDFRRKVRESLRAAGVRSPFSRDALDEAGARHGPPFAVVCSNTMDLEVGRFWPVRKYPWGNVEAMLTMHSDLPVLRRLLFEAGYCELKDATEQRFHQYRHQQCAGSKNIVVAAASGLARRLLLAGGVALAVWVVAAGSGLVTDPARRNRAVKVVKEKVSEVADTAVEAAHEIGDKAQDVADATKRTVSQAVTKASQALESEEARLKREAEELRLEEEARRAKGPWGWLRRGKKVPGDS